jgi:hypothetical protein
MARKKTNLAITYSRKESAALLLEQLRYAGIVAVEEKYDDYLQFTLYPPPGVDSALWAEQNAKRMASFGIFADPVEEV